MHLARSTYTIAANPLFGAEFPSATPAFGRSWWAGILSRRRVQILGAILFGAVIPGLFQWPTSGFGLAFGRLWFGDPIVDNGIIANASAIMLGFIIFRQIRAHHSVNFGGYILYAFSMAYGVLAVLLLLLRAKYSRFELGAGFSLSVIWFFVVTNFGLNSRIRIAVIPSRDLSKLPESSGFNWLHIDEPQLDSSSINGVVADSLANHDPAWQRFLVQCALSDVPIYDSRQLTEQITGRIEINQFSGNSLPSTLHSLTYAKIKQVVDLAVTVVVSPIFILVIVVAAISIRICDGAPVIFKQYRTGYRGRPFVIYKLRTMKAAVEGGSDFTTTDDSRITRLGHILRKYRIDEFPQILNVLKSEMSWIGPRPESVRLSEWYEREVPYYSYRHMVRPGISGWAQVHQGNVAQVDAASVKLQYDFYYIKYLSPWLDLLVLAKTIKTMRTGFGYR